MKSCVFHGESLFQCAGGIHGTLTGINAAKALITFNYELLNNVIAPVMAAFHWDTT